MTGKTGGPRRIKVSASLMCDSFRHLEVSLKEMERCGVDLIHVDIMDGTFVPNFTLGPDIIRAVRQMTTIPIDLHLMSVTPERHLETFLSCGLEHFSIHQEACWPLFRSILRIKEAGVKAGVALNPATPVASLEHLLPLLDFVLLMTVEPGYAGQKLVSFAFEKIGAMRALAGKLKPTLEIEVDGNVSFEHAPRMVAQGADILVAGTSSLFKPGLTIEQAYAKLLAACGVTPPQVVR